MAYYNAKTYQNYQEARTQLLKDGFELCATRGTASYWSRPREALATRDWVHVGGTKNGVWLITVCEPQGK